MRACSRSHQLSVRSANKGGAQVLYATEAQSTCSDFRLQYNNIMASLTK